jgi:hypothetical protein
MGSFVLDLVVRRRIGIVRLGKEGGMGVRLLIVDHVSYASVHSYLVSYYELCIRMMIDPFLTAHKERHFCLRGRPHQCWTIKDLAI